MLDLLSSLSLICVGLLPRTNRPSCRPSWPSSHSHYLPVCLTVFLCGATPSHKSSSLSELSTISTGQPDCSRRTPTVPLTGLLVRSSPNRPSCRPSWLSSHSHYLPVCLTVFLCGATPSHKSSSLSELSTISTGQPDCSRRTPTVPLTGLLVRSSPASSTFKLLAVHILPAYARLLPCITPPFLLAIYGMSPAFLTYPLRSPGIRFPPSIPFHTVQPLPRHSVVYRSALVTRSLPCMGCSPLSLCLTSTYFIPHGLS